LAELIFLGIEFHKEDVLTDLDYRLNLSRPRLLIVPVKETSPGRRTRGLPNDPISSKWEQSPFVDLLVVTPRIAVLLMIVLILLALLFLLLCQNGALLGTLPR